MNILEDLYYGNISPIDHNLFHDERYWTLNSHATKDLEALAGLLEGGEMNEVFNRYQDSSGEVESYRNLLSFIDGFRLGAKIALEIADTE